MKSHIHLRSNPNVRLKYRVSEKASSAHQFYDLFYCASKTVDNSSFATDCFTSVTEPFLAQDLYKVAMRSTRVKEERKMILLC
jgi:hypothetical protein